MDIPVIRLSTGGHQTRELGTCLLEATSLLAGEEHGDSPECADDLLSHIGQWLNDTAPDDEALQGLLEFAYRLVGSGDDEAYLYRRMMCLLFLEEYNLVPRCWDSDAFINEEIASWLFSFLTTPTGIPDSVLWAARTAFCTQEELLGLGAKQSFKLVRLRAYVEGFECDCGDDGCQALVDIRRERWFKIRKLFDTMLSFTDIQDPGAAALRQDHVTV